MKPHSAALFFVLAIGLSLAAPTRANLQFESTNVSQRDFNGRSIALHSDTPCDEIHCASYLHTAGMSWEYMMCVQRNCLSKGVLNPLGMPVANLRECSIRLQAKGISSAKTRCEVSHIATRDPRFVQKVRQGLIAQFRRLDPNSAQAQNIRATLVQIGNSFSSYSALANLEGNQPR